MARTRCSRACAGAAKARTLRRLPAARARPSSIASESGSRTGIHVDRIASAWLIQRFIDPAARFKFVSERDYAPEKRELRFDMFDAEFSHEGDACTFEVLCQRMRLHAPGLAAIAEIVHDIDLKDRKFGRQETEGIAAAIAGITRLAESDAQRLERGGQLFDELLAFVAAKRD